MEIKILKGKFEDVNIAQTISDELFPINTTIVLSERVLKIIPKQKLIWLSQFGKLEIGKETNIILKENSKIPESYAEMARYIDSIIGMENIL